jgi:hypothetical protein
MSLEGNLEYALARVHARHAARPPEAEWRRVGASRDLTHYFDAARSSSLASWIATLEPSADSHGIERALRTEWRRYVARVASWHPRPWQPWLGWLATLPTLPLLALLARPEPVPAWLLADPVCGPLAPGSPEQRSAALRRTPLAALAPGTLAAQSLMALWHAHWRSLTPAANADTRALIATFSALFGRFAATLAVGDDSSAARERLAAALSRLFRAGAGTVVASVCHLALLALDLERLRGDLASRRLFARSDTNGLVRAEGAA